MRRWPRLRQWLEEDREILVWRQRLGFIIQFRRKARPVRSISLGYRPLHQVRFGKFVATRLRILRSAKILPTIENQSPAKPDEVSAESHCCYARSGNSTWMIDSSRRWWSAAPEVPVALNRRRRPMRKEARDSHGGGGSHAVLVALKQCDNGVMTDVAERKSNYNL